MNISTLLQALKAIVQAAYANRNDASKWGGWIDVFDATDEGKKIVLDGKFKSASVELQGLKFVIEINGKDVTVEGRPGLHHLEIFLDGARDPEAHAVVASKATIQHPLRAGLDLRPVTLDGHETRFNMRYTG